MAIGYDNARLKSIRDRDVYMGARRAGNLSTSTALKNVSDTYDQLLADLDNGQSKGDVREAVRDINHIIMRLESIRDAIDHHTFEATDTDPRTCVKCGKYREYKRHA